MTPARILLIFGTRPEAIKMAPILLALRDRTDRFQPRVCLTGQHREMLDQVLGAFDIRPDMDLELMRDDQSPAQVASAALAGLTPVIASERPDLVLVQGDTTTTLAAALAAYLQKVRVGHVEAGLRTTDRYRPFPEEMNRRLTSVAADLHFAPTERARRNLRQEGIPEDRIVVTGNTVVDALLRTVRSDYAFQDPGLAAIDFRRPVILVTMHRRESFGEPLRVAAEAIRDLAEAREELQVIFPVHLNPRVRAPMEEILGGRQGVLLLEPLGYVEFVHVMARATLTLTDSGGIQEEAPSLNLPVLIMRDVTERPEGLEAGTALLVGTDRERIVSESLRLVDDEGARARMAAAKNPYGDGQAARRIVDVLDRFLSSP